MITNLSFSNNQIRFNYTFNQQNLSIEIDILLRTVNNNSENITLNQLWLSSSLRNYCLRNKNCFFVTTSAFFDETAASINSGSSELFS